MKKRVMPIAFLAVLLMTVGIVASAQEDAPKLLNTVKECLDNIELDYEDVEGVTAVSIPMEEGDMDNGTWDVYVVTDEDAEQVVIYSDLGMMVPKSKRAVAAEFLTRANFGLNIGNFEMDFADGQVRFKTSIDVEGGSLSDTQVKNLVGINVLTTDEYLPGLQKVIAGTATAREAIEEIEG